MKQLLRNFIVLLVIALSTSALPHAFGKAAYSDGDEMIKRAEVIAIVDISQVEQTVTKSQPFDYSEIAHATVHQTFKGSLPQNVKLYGGESFICAQVHFAPGRYLVFLRRNGDLLVGCNWHLGVRPIKDAQVEWFAADKSMKLSWQRLFPIVQRIREASVAANSVEPR